MGEPANGDHPGPLRGAAARAESFSPKDKLSAAVPGFTINEADAPDVVQPTGASKPSDGITWPDRQLQRKFDKHAADFGVGGTYNP